MKFKIIKVEATTAYNITSEVKIWDDNDVLVYEGSMNFANNSTDLQIAEQEIIQGITNKYQQIINERDAKLKEVAESLINQVVEV